MKRFMRDYGGLLAFVVFLALLAFQVAGLDPLVQQGTTNLDALTLSGELNAEQVTSTDDMTVTDDLTVSGLADVAGTLQYGANDLYPVGFASSGQQAVYGTDTITGTATAAHGLTTVTFALCTLGEDPTSGAGDSAMCTVSITTNVVTLDIWQDDFVTAATEANSIIHWLVIGAP